ncbi:PSD1 and planctomycete cytochrome C domain-containing protein [Stieleria sp. TO1_6]|uniref:PSD1 and planctomycete cytochrome C domain-containing protein n=1 Tax=Stieleria tagensis TaxID=2956795 RepID=UPI00209B8267|nr:PSD1 and planctomycete cytochrome C domain-containing protein [Stieleria tagensis]MCO8122729.1 PSD1 and planctomycete cytochrome C domain-containing protein [Stieleria tagensis]
MFRQLITLTLLTLIAVESAVLAADDSSRDLSNESETLFVRRIEPLLRTKCWGCHGNDADAIEGELDLRQLDHLLAGGESGEPSLLPGRPDDSPLYLVMTRSSEDWSAMPPKQAEAITEEQQRWVHRWIETGAHWPSSERQTEIANDYADRWSAEDGVTVQTSGGLDEAWTNRRYKPETLWGYQPVVRPVVDAADGDHAAIDALIDQAMPAGLEPVGPVDRTTLIRRATFDLIGLPPTPAEIDAFVDDPRDDDSAFATVVDRLLDSPHYGERMAQHWLDVVRYADSSGLANDFHRGGAWRYRDYVVRSFNDDKPYDQFVIEQIAGDEWKPDDPEMHIATGFLRMGPWELTGMEVPKVARQRFLDDVTNSVGETFLAHSLQCAKCHDHKFDPVPTQDYYGIQAVFATTQLAERKTPRLKSENVHGFELERYLDVRRKEYQRILAELDQVLLDNALQWYANNGLADDDWREIVDRLQAENHSGVFNEARKEIGQGRSEQEYPPKLVGFTPQEFGRERVARKGLQALAFEYDTYRPFALSVYNGRTPQVKSINAPFRMPDDRMTKGELEQGHILTGGDPFSPGQPVRPSVLSVLGDIQTEPIPETIAGRRLALAQWIADPRNPLTTRTIVNRIWMWHFGTPIAGNPNNFGSTGKPPTHPQLLDWLAATLVDDGWSIKQLHRRIMLSAAYRRGTEPVDRKQWAELDPTGTSYAVFRPRRLTAEEIRDAMLAASGELTPTVGGLPCQPEINLEVALQPRQVMGAFAAAWTPDPLPQDRHRRSIYACRLRGLADPIQEVFNTPSPDFSCEQRDASNVTPQVFALFNSRRSHARALALANRCLNETDTDQEAIDLCYRLVYGRAATADQQQLIQQHWQQTEQQLPDHATAWTQQPTEVQRDAVEENTGEPFRFVETLHSNKDFVPDLQPTEVDKHTRALADICLAILNSNEFVYVY